MAREYILFALILLAGCDKSPNATEVAKQAKVELQNTIDRDWAARHPVVKSISLVQVSNPHYEGEAEIESDRAIFDLPVNVTSDGKVTLVFFDRGALLRDIEGNLNRRISALKGKYSDYVLSESMSDFLPNSLRLDREKFATRLEVIVPIESTGRFFFGSGCHAHACGADGAAWTIDKETGELSAIIMSDLPGIPGVMPEHESFQLYNCEAEKLPAPLADWASDNGMTDANVESDNPPYQAPPK